MRVRTEVVLPALDDVADPLDHLQQFHEAMRDMVGWAEGIVDDDGAARPDDARLLRAFITGPLRAHLHDEDAHVVPLLAGRRGRWLDSALSSTQRGHGLVQSAASALLSRLDDLARGVNVDPDMWRALVVTLAAAVDRALAFEDDVLLPTARLLLDDDERAHLHDLLRHAQAQRTASSPSPSSPSAIVCDEPAPRRLGIVRTDHRNGGTTIVYADCPRRRTVDVNGTCAGCRHYDGVDADGDLHCAIEETPIGGAARVGDLMTRDVRCVSRDVPALGLIDLLADACVHGVPVVDACGKPVGVVSQTDVMRAIARRSDLEQTTVGDIMMHAPFVVSEDAAIDDATRLLAFEGVHRLPVVNEAQHVVGIVSALDLVRWSCARPS